MAIFSVSTSAELTSAFKNAKAGDLIELAPGTYKSATIQGETFSKAVTLTSADRDNRATIDGSLTFVNCSNIKIAGIDFERSSMSNGYLLHTRGGKDITISDVTMKGYLPTAAEGADPNDPTAPRGEPITGLGMGYGLRIKGTDNVTIQNVEISDVQIAARLEDGTGTVFRNNDIHHVREGVNIFDQRGMVIEKNYFHEFTPFMPVLGSKYDHPDMIQFWGVASDYGLYNLKIRDNVFYQPEDWIPVQSIFGHLDQAPKGVAAKNFEITGNTIINSQLHGIRLGDVNGGRVADNLILSNTPDPDREGEIPRIVLVDTKNIEVMNNTVIEMPNGKGVDLRHATGSKVHDNLTLSRDPDAPDYYGKVLEALLKNPNLFLKDGRKMTDAVTDLLATDKSGGIPGKENIPEAGVGNELDPAGGMELGTVAVRQANGDVWHKMVFSETIENARVITGPLSHTGSDEATIRLRNVTDTGFEFQIDEWNSLDGSHAVESFSWMAMSAGSYRMPDGTMVQSGRIRLQDDDWKDVALDAHSASDVFAFAQVTSRNGAAAVTTRIDEVSAEGFRVQMQEEEAGDQTHVREMVDWIVFETESGLARSREFLVDDGWAGIAGKGEMGAADALIAGMQTANGGDTATLRHHLDRGDVTFTIDEERSLDSETIHTDEQVAALILETGYYDLFT